MRRAEIRAVVLAAGSSSRTAPLQKLLAPFRGRPLIEYAIEAALPWMPAVIAGPAIAAHLMERDDCEVLRNEHPERGMSYSLKVADAAIPAGVSLLVFLADKPLAHRTLAQTICTSSGAQVAYPVHAVTGIPGHPVLFGPSARQKIAALPDGDTLHRLRDDPTLVRRVVLTMDEGAFFDVDDVDTLDGDRRLFEPLAEIASE